MVLGRLKILLHSTGLGQKRLANVRWKKRWKEGREDLRREEAVVLRHLCAQTYEPVGAGARCCCV